MDFTNGLRKILIFGMLLSLRVAISTAQAPFQFNVTNGRDCHRVSHAVCSEDMSGSRIFCRCRCEDGFAIVGSGASRECLPTEATISAARNRLPAIPANGIRTELSGGDAQCPSMSGAAIVNTTTLPNGHKVCTYSCNAGFTKAQNARACDRDPSPPPVAAPAATPVAPLRSPSPTPSRTPRNSPASCTASAPIVPAGAETTYTATCLNEAVSAPSWCTTSGHSGFQSANWGMSVTGTYQCVFTCASGKADSSVRSLRSIRCTVGPPVAASGSGPSTPGAAPTAAPTATPTTEPASPPAATAPPAPPAVTAPPQVGSQNPQPAPTAVDAAAAARQDRLTRAAESARLTQEADAAKADAAQHRANARSETAQAEAATRAAAAARASGNETRARELENSAADHRKNAGFETADASAYDARAANEDHQSADAIKEDLAAERPGALAAASKDMQERRAAAGDGPCTSTRMTGIGDSGTACRSTRTTIDAIDMTDTITDKVGEVVSTYAGANAVAKVEKDPTKMQEYYGAAAELYDTQVGINTGQATIDTVAGALSFARNRVHNWHENTFKKAADAAAKADNTRGLYAGAGAKTAENIGRNNGRALEAAGGTTAAEQASRARIIAENEADSAAVRTLAGAAASEQSGYAGEALGRMMKSGLRALGQIGYLTTNALEATKMRKERDKYSCPGNKRKNDDDSCPATDPDGGTGDTGPNGEVINDPNGSSNGDARAPGGGIMPDGNMSVSKAVADDSEHKTDGLPSGGGVKEIDTPQGSKASGPEAGTFKEGNGGAPAGGGGGGAANVAGTGAASEVSGGEPGSTSMAAEAKGGGYEAGEGGGRYGGGGTPGSANIGGGLPDVNELLAGLLPKKEDGPGNGIVQFAERGLASAPASLLDAKTNIFERLHTTYLDKHKRGVVGIK